MSTKFNVTMGVEDMEGKTVLVFIKPENPQRDQMIHAWQVLDGSAGATDSFNYEANVSTDITSHGPKPGSANTSARLAVMPGQLLSAVSSPDSQSLMLQLTPSSQTQDKLTSEQCAVINKTNPFIQFTSNWYVDGRPVVSMPNVDANKTVNFELKPNFYFMVASPPYVGQTYTIPQLSDMTKYAMPGTATEVNVTLRKDQGQWIFDFNEQ